MKHIDISEKVDELLKYCSVYQGHVNTMDERKEEGIQVTLQEEEDILVNLDKLQFIRLIGEAGDGKQVINKRGASLSKMLSDKIYAISGERVCRRMKDVLDIYVISFITKIDMDELCQIWAGTGRELGNFEAYKTQTAELGKAYDKMKGIKNKPDFVEVYSRVNNVICELERRRELEISRKDKQR